MTAQTIQTAIKLHQPCPDCGSSDALSEYTDHTFCFACSKYTDIPEGSNANLHMASSTVHSSGDNSNSASTGGSGLKQIPDIGFKPLRGITAETMQRYKTWTVGNDQFYPYFRKSSNGTDYAHVANKIRTLDKKGFLVQGQLNSSALFGQNLFPAGSAKSITLVEGELDAMSAYQMQGSKWPVVSVKGASSAEKDVTDNFEYLNSFENIVICFDADKPHKKPNGDVWYPGQEAALRVAALFPLGKVRIITLEKGKDANEYLQKGLSDDFKNEWFRAAVWTPAGIKLAKDMWEEISAAKNYETRPYPWEGLNAFTYGIRLSELVLLTADTGVGKTSILKEIEHHILTTTKDEAEPPGIGILHLEEPNGDTLLGLMSITANKPLHIPDVRSEVDNEELRKYYDATCNTDRIVIWDHFGSNEIDGVLATVRHMRNLGCKYIFLDHLSIVVSDQSGDERKQLDEISTKLKTLCMELNICVVAVIHINRKGEVRGSAGVEQLSNMVFKIYRDKEDKDEWRRNVTKIVVGKNRFCGKTGPACYLYYNPETGRLEELNKDQIKRYEEHIETQVYSTKEEDWS